MLSTTLKYICKFYKLNRENIAQGHLLKPWIIWSCRVQVGFIISFITLLTLHKKFGHIYWRNP